MDWSDIGTIAGCLVLAFIVLRGFRGATRVPPSGRDHCDEAMTPVHLAAQGSLCGTHCRETFV